MDTLIIIFFGSVIGWLISKKPYDVFWDIVFGVLGAMTSNLLLDGFGLPAVSGYNIYSFLVAMVGAVTVIYFSRSLHLLPEIEPVVLNLFPIVKAVPVPATIV